MYEASWQQTGNKVIICLFSISKAHKLTHDIVSY